MGKALQIAKVLSGALTLLPAVSELAVAQQPVPNMPPDDE